MILRTTSGTTKSPFEVESAKVEGGQNCIKLVISNYLSQQNALNQTNRASRCVTFTVRDDHLSRCSCGQLVAQHGPVAVAAKEEATPLVQLEVQPAERWSPLRHTQTSPTDAYGLLEFQGSGHVNKATVLTLAAQFENFDELGFLLNP